jgi:hypothetical protein
MAREAAPKARPRLTRSDDDDSHWLSFVVVHKMLTEYYGDPQVAASYLTRVLAAGEVRYLCRRLADWAIERPPSDFWRDYKVAYGSEGLQVVPRRIASAQPPLPPGAVVIRSASLEAKLARRSNEERRPNPPPLKDVSFFARREDITKLRPSIAAKMQGELKAEPKTDDRGKPGRRPKTKWKLYVAAELCRTGIDGMQTPTAADLVKSLAKNQNLHPDDSEVRKLRTALIRLLF